jgi:hypothetical protein
MKLPEAELSFLRDLLKASRQKQHHVRWVDRDGSERVTVLAPAENVRLAKLAQQLGVAKPEVLRQAAHIAVPR